MKTWIKVLALVLALLVLGSTAVLAEADIPVEEPAPQEEVQPSAPAPVEPEPEAPVAVPEAVEPAEAPAEEAPAEPADEEAPEEAEEAPQVEVEAGEGVEGEIIEIEDPAEPPKGLSRDENHFTGSVKIKLKETESKDIFFGDKVTLVAKITGANADYDIQWEVNPTGKEEDWKVIPDETEEEYEFIVTPENVDFTYRVVLVAA